MASKEDAIQMGLAGLGKSTLRRSVNTLGISKICHVLGRTHTGALSSPLALASLVLGSPGPLVASLKSVAAVLRFRSGDQRLISRDAER
jgi:hypothetical protein